MGIRQTQLSNGLKVKAELGNINQIVEVGQVLQMDYTSSLCYLLLAT